MGQCVCEFGSQARIACGVAKLGRFAFEQHFGRSFSHDEDGCNLCRAPRDDQKPRGPAPAFARCKEATNDRSKNLEQVISSNFRNHCRHRKLTGPASGPRLKSAVARPLSAGRVTSAMVPPPMFKGMPPAQPERKRNTMNPAMLVLRPLPTMNAMNAMLAAWYMGSRPKNSPRGARNMGPRANPSRKIVTASELTVAESTAKSAMTPSIPGATIVVAMLLHRSPHVSR